MEINAAQEKFKTDAKKREVFETDIDATKIVERQGRARRAQELVKSDPTIAGVMTTDCHPIRSPEPTCRPA
jgi:hypothetical protein